METLLNLAWVMCSCGLIWRWLRDRNSNPEPFRAQLLALASVVLLLLPVISLSDDLMAMQSPAETDTAVRRALQPDHEHPSFTPNFLAMPEVVFASLPKSNWTLVAIQASSPAPARNFHTRSLDSRPPPQA